MPSRKRLKGRARKGKNEKLQKDNDFFIRSGVCSHGWSFDDDKQRRDKQQRFVVEFAEALEPLRGSLLVDETVSQLPHRARRMAKLKLYSDDWLKFFREIVEFDLEWCLSYLIAIGTHSLLDSTEGSTDSIEVACDFALLSLSLRLEFEGGTLEDNASLQRKVRDLVHGNERDIVRFFYTSANCACLKDRYNEVRFEPKMGSCYHVSCRRNC